MKAVGKAARLALLAWTAGCAPQASSVAPPRDPRPLRIALLAFLDEIEVEEGFPNRSARFLLPQQDPERVDSSGALRVWLPANGAILLPELELGDGRARLELGAGCEWLDGIWPDEGSSAAAPAGEPITSEFALEWVTASGTTTLAAKQVRMAAGAPDGRVREPWSVALPAGRGRVRVRTRRSEGRAHDVARMPTLWGPTLVAPAGAPARVASSARRAPVEVVLCDLLDPRLAAEVRAPATGTSGERGAGGAGEEWQPLRNTALPSCDLGSIGAPQPAPLRRPLVAVEGHFQAGAGFAVPYGGTRPALAFAGDCAVRFDLPAEAVATAAELRFDWAFHEFGGCVSRGRAQLEVRLDGVELARLDLTGEEDPARQGWSPPCTVELPPVDASASARRFELHVKLFPFDPPLLANGLELARPWLGLARPRILRSYGGGDVLTTFPAPPPARPEPQIPPTALPPPAPLNVLFLCVETWRADAVGFGGAGAGITPRLDELARRALVFKQATAPAPWTLPSVASYLTGLRPHQHGVVSELSDVLPDRCRTLAELASERGARTFACVTNALLRTENGFDAGFERYALWPYADAAQVNELFLGWLDATTPERFFAYLHYFEPHAPLNAPGELRDGDVPERLRGRSFGGAAQELRDALRTTGDARTAADALEFLRGRYRGEVRHVDRQIGALLDELRARGDLDRTLLIVTGDHGEEFGEHRWFGHGSQLYEESTHVPLLVAGPGIAPGRIAAPVEARIASRLAAAALGEPDFPGADRALRLPASLTAEAFEEALAAAEVLCITEKLVDTWTEGWPESLEGLAERVASRPGRSLRVGDRKAIARFAPPGAPSGDEHDGALAGALLELLDLARDPAETSGRRVAPADAPIGLWHRFQELHEEERALRAAMPSSELPPELIEVLRQQGYLDAGIRAR